MSNTYYFLGGFPRSGSTLLCNILAQNPRIHATHTSGCMDVMFGVRNSWNNLIEHKAHPEPEKLPRVLRAILESYYSDISKPVVIDKCRGWASLMEMASSIVAKPKLIAPVRDVRDVLSSFEKLWRKQANKGQLPGESQNYFQFQTVAGRCDFWMRNDQPAGLAYNRIVDAIRRGWEKSILLVDYDDLCINKQSVMRRIYNFLEEPEYIHNFEHVEQVTFEDDTFHGFDNLHAIKPKVEPQKPQWPTVLGNVADKYKNMNFWKP